MFKKRGNTNKKVDLNYEASQIQETDKVNENVEPESLNSQSMSVPVVRKSLLYNKTKNNLVSLWAMEIN